MTTIDRRAGFAARTLWLLLCGVLAAAPAHGQRLAPVELANAERQSIVETLNLTGTLNSPNTASLSPDVEGRVIEIRVDAGHRVEAGDVLCRLDDELAQLELEQTTAAEREAKANLADTERRLKEVQELLQKRAFPESEARSLAAQVERDRAIYQRRTAERAHAAAVLERHVLKAPFDGVVAARHADLGERVGPDAPVLELVAVDRLQLDLQVPQGYFQRVGADTPVTVRVDALPEETFTATLAFVVPVSDPSARTFLVRAFLDNTPVRMAPGMSVRAILRIGTGRDGIAVPRDALIRYPDGRTIIWVVEDNGGQRTVQERLVKTGLAFDGNVEITNGLSEGEPVVVRGNENLQPGQGVRIADAN